MSLGSFTWRALFSAASARASPSRPTAIALVIGLGSWACLVRLNDPYKHYSADGDVTGDPAACAGAPAEGLATQTGPKAPRIIGRTSKLADDPAPRIVWSGTQVTARFAGASDVFLTLATLVPVTNDALTGPTTFYTVVVDGGLPTTISIDGSKGTAPQVLAVATGLTTDAHEIVITRESEVDAGAHYFYGLFSDAAGKTPLTYLPATVRPRRIQLIGDSPAVGSGVLGANALCTFSYDTERASVGFGALAAASLDAELTTIATRTVGVFVNADGSNANTISTLYGCADPSVAPCISAGDLTKDPSAPQVIVLMLGSSDLVRANAAASDFQSAYEPFVKSVRAANPKAHVFCTLSPLLTDLNTKSQRTNAKNAIHAVVADVADPKIYALDFPDQGTENGLGCEENPSPKTHQIMAGILATAIREKTCW